MEPKATFTIYTVPDLKAAQSFYERLFGFKVVFDSGWYCHLITPAGLQLAFLQPHSSEQPEIFHHPYSGGAILSFEVGDARAAYQEALSQGAAIVLHIRDEPWGQRHFAVRDPNGIVVDVVQTIEAAQEYQAQYVQP